MFLRKYIFHFLAYTVLFVPVGKRSNSRSQMFCKIDALKNPAILTGKRLGWRFFLINFIKKRRQPNVNMSFLNMLCYHFSLEAVSQGMAKNNPTEKEIEAKIIKRH